MSLGLKSLVAELAFRRTAKYDERCIRENALGENALCQAESLARHLPFNSGMPVLELGCGKATSSIFLARELDFQVWAADSGTTATENCQRAGTLDAEALVFPMRVDAHSLYGRYMAGVAVAPVSAELMKLVDAPLNVNGKPNGLRAAVVAFCAANCGEWEMRVQLCTDLEKMPIEDASVTWPEELSPYIAVGRITVDPQVAWNEARSSAVDDGTAFSPWHGVAAHRPIGSIMRVRKAAYAMSAKFRAERNGQPVSEPQNLDAFPN